MSSKTSEAESQFNPSEFKFGRDDGYSHKFQSKIEDPEEKSDFYYDTFPHGFLFGAATSACQIEGGWNADGKGESMWDHMVRTMPEKIEDGSNCDQGCDSYHRYMDDVAILKELGANVYRFSINWPRILPNGDPKEVNQAGIDYYNKLIDELLQNSIVPLATIFHWDLPQTLVSKYTWVDEELRDYFVSFARICFASFGDRVKLWITINEPWIHAIMGYDLGVHPPFMTDPAITYRIIHNLLKAHAETFRMYQDEFKAAQGGKLGLSHDCWGFEPADPNSTEDLEATERAVQFKLGTVLHPLIHGCYPPIMREYIDRKSVEEGRSESRLPSFDEVWSTKIKGSFDFIGLNHYSCEKVTTLEKAPANTTRLTFSRGTKLGFDVDQEAYRYHDVSWPTAQSWWLKYTPWALRSLLNYIKDNYGNPEVMITENGWSDGREVMEDYDRLHYHKAYLNELLKAVKTDGCNVSGYCAWTLLDSWEWNAGHTVTFGLHHVDMDDPKRKRTPRASAKYLVQVYKNHGFINQK